MSAAAERSAGRATPGLRSAYAAFATMPTRWSDNDIYGHMNNVVHYALFDSAVNGWLIENGLIDIHAGETIGLVVETGCRYFSELAFPAPVTAGIRVARIGNSSVRYEVGLFGGDGDVAAAEGFFIHVYVDRATRRPTALPPSMRAKLAEIAR